MGKALTGELSYPLDRSLQGRQLQNRSICFCGRLRPQKGASHKGKNLLSRESKFFSLRVAPFEGGAKYFHVKVISLEGVNCNKH